MAPANPKPNARPNPKPNAAKVVIPIVLGLVIVLGIVAVVASRGSESTDNGNDAGAGVEQTRPVEVTGAALPEFAASANDAARGQSAPVATGAAFSGDRVTIGQPGRPQLIFFLAHWCPHCQNEVPVITKWIDADGAPEGIDLFAVSTGVNEAQPNYPPSEWLARENWPVRTLADDENGSTAGAYGLSAYPYFVALDGDGKVVARATGELGIDKIEQMIALAKGDA